jgi:hypothetical protein
MHNIENMKKWTKSWSSWSGKTSESSLHLDDIQDSPKDTSDATDTDVVYQERHRPRNAVCLQQQAAVGPPKSSSNTTSTATSNIQEHINRLHDYSDLCERAHRLASPDPPSSPNGWVRRFKNRETPLLSGSERSLSDSNPPTPHGSFLVPRTSAPRPHFSPPSSPLSAPCSPVSFGRRKSCPTSEALEAATAASSLQSGGGDGGGGGGDPADSAVYRRQVAAALQGGRTVWL